MTHTKAFKTWQARLASGTLTKPQVQRFYNVVYPVAWGGQYLPASQLTQEEAEILVTALEQTPVKVTDEQAQQGRDWLAKYWKRRGLPELDYRAITHFTFDGAAVIDENRYRASFAPIYAAHWANGDRFTYNVCAWQAGRGSHVDWTYSPARALELV